MRGTSRRSSGVTVSRSGSGRSCCSPPPSSRSPSRRDRSAACSASSPSPGRWSGWSRSASCDRWSRVAASTATARTSPPRSCSPCCCGGGSNPRCSPSSSPPSSANWCAPSPLRGRLQRRCSSRCRTSPPGRSWSRGGWAATAEQPATLTPADIPLVIAAFATYHVVNLTLVGTALAFRDHDPWWASVTDNVWWYTRTKVAVFALSPLIVVVIDDRSELPAPAVRAVVAHLLDGPAVVAPPRSSRRPTR